MVIVAMMKVTVVLIIIIIILISKNISFQMTTHFKQRKRKSSLPFQILCKHLTIHIPNYVNLCARIASMKAGFHNYNLKNTNMVALNTQSQDLHPCICMKHMVKFKCSHKLISFFKWTISSFLFFKWKFIMNHIEFFMWLLKSQSNS